MPTSRVTLPLAELRVLGEIASRIGAAGGIDALGDAARDALRRLTLHAEHGLWLRDLGEVAGFHWFRHGFDAPAMTEEAARVVRSGAAMEAPCHAGVPTRLWVPVGRGDAIVGALGIASAEVSAFEERDRETLRFVADLISTAYGRLLAEWQARLAERETNRHRFDSFLGALPDAVVGIDTRGEVIYWNDGATRLFGWSEAEMLGSSLHRIMPERMRSGHGVGMARYLDSGVAHIIGRPVEFRALHAQGHELPVELLVSRVGDGDAAYFVGVIRDIADRKRLEAARDREAADERRFAATLLELSRAPASDLVAFRRRVSEAVSRSLHVDRVSVWRWDVNAIDCEELFDQASGEHSEGLRLAEAHFQTYFDAMRTENAIVADDARTHPATRCFDEVYLQPLGIHSMLDVPMRGLRGLRGVVCVESRAPRVWRAADERFCVEAANLLVQAYDRQLRRRLEQRHEVVLHAIAEGVIACDVDERITLMNPIAEALCGWRQAEALGRPLGEVLPLVSTDARLPVRGIGNIAVDRPQARQMLDTLLVVHREGIETPVAVGSAPIIEEGVVTGSVVTLRDVTHEAETRRAIQERNQRLRSVGEAIPDLLFSLAVDGRVQLLQSGPSVDARHEPAQTDIRTLLGVPLAGRFLDAVREVVRTSEVKTLEYTIDVLDERQTFEARLARMNAEEATVIVRDVTEDRARAEAFRAQSERLAAVLGSTSAVIYVSRLPSFEIEYVSDSITELLGFTADDVSAPGFWERAVHPDDRERVLTGLAGLLETGHHVHEYRHLHRDGTYRWLRDDVRAIYDAAGNPVRGVGASFDITARKRDEAALSDLTARLTQQADQQRVLLALSSELTRASGDDAVYTILHRALPQLPGVDRLAITERRDDGSFRVRVFAPADDPRLFAWDEVMLSIDRSSAAEAMALGEPLSSAMRPADTFADWRALRDRGGMCHFVTVPLSGPTGMFGALHLASRGANGWGDEALSWAVQFGVLVGGHLSLQQASSALQRVNEELERGVAERTRDLQASEERFELLFQHAPQAMIIVDGAGKILQSNDGARVVFGFDDEPLEGRPLSELVPMGARPGHEKLVDNFQAQATVRTMSAGRPVRALRRDGTEFTAEVGLVPIAFQGKVHVVAGITDVSDRVAAQIALTSSLREKETLLREIHHRVKNNLQIISSLLMLQSEQMPEQAQAMMRESVYRVRSMALIHQQFYGVASLERIDVGGYARGLAMSLAAALAPTAKVEVVSDEAEVEVVTAVPIGLVLNELLTNAFKYGLAKTGSVGCDVRVEVRRDPDALHLSVSDAGPGLPAGFNPATASSLGLELVRSLTRQLRGELTYGSGGALGGAWFEIRCPLVEAATRTATPVS
jgi:PAS domain S-box-containing protein